MAVNRSKLERFLGTPYMAALDEAMAGWYGPPIPISCPGRVAIGRDSTLYGHFVGGDFMSLVDWIASRLRKSAVLNMAGIGSISELLSATTVDNTKQILVWQKADVTKVVGASYSLWANSTGADSPGVGITSGGTPNGTVHTSADAGSIPFVDAPDGATQHILSGTLNGGIGGQPLLLYDRLWSVAKTMSSSTAENSNGTTPTRYQSNTSTDLDSASGNFCFPEVRTTLSNTTHAWTVVYTKQDGSGTESTTFDGVNTADAHRIDIALTEAPTWHIPLEPGDTGVKNVLQLDCDTNEVTGALNFVIGHPLVWLVPSYPTGRKLMSFDFMNTPYARLERIFDGACVAILEPNAIDTTASTFYGTLVTASA